MLDIAAVCLVVTALLAYLNHRFVRLPTTIGVDLGALRRYRWQVAALAIGGTLLSTILVGAGM